MEKAATTEAGEPPRLPQLPKPIVSASEKFPEATIKLIKDEFTVNNAAREAMFSKTKTLSESAHLAEHALQTGDAEGATAALAAAGTVVDEILTDIEGATNGWFLRGAGAVSGAFERWISSNCMQTFFSTGRLAPRSAFGRFKDSEYICGVINFCQELGRYAVGRATVGDAASVVLCRDLTQEVFGELLQFDFRNGPLRRKYDGVKYVMRRLEDILYELSLTGAYVAPVEEAAQPKKRLKVDASVDAAEDRGATLLNSADFTAMRTTMEAYDKKREAVIKGTRDLQKLSKQAIFSLHRNDLEKSANQLEQVETKGLELFNAYIKDEPALRQGSYSNSMEEYAEAVLFKVWLENKTIPAMEGEAFKGMIDSTEYIGGLVDFTGEVGRFAVAAAAKRDTDAVEASLAADLTVQDVLMRLGLPGKLSKKEGALRTNVKKLEHVLYELSIVKATGRKVTVSKTEEGGGASGGGEAAE